MFNRKQIKKLSFFKHEIILAQFKLDYQIIHKKYNWNKTYLLMVT